MIYQKNFLKDFYFTKAGKPTVNKETHYYELDNFTEYFIHYLSDHLVTLEINKYGDGLDNLQAFKELYIQCMLDCVKDYRETEYQSP